MHEIAGADYALSYDEKIVTVPFGKGFPTSAMLEKIRLVHL